MPDQSLGRAVLDLVTDPTKLRAGMAAARSEVASSLSTTQAAATAALAKTGATMMRTGQAMTLGVTVPILAAGKAIFDTGKNFEQTLNQIVGLTDVTRDQLAGIKTDVIAIAEETGRAPQELAEAFYFVASAGFTASEAMDVLRTAAMASATGLGTTQDVAKILGGVLNAYGHENITAARAADILTASVKDGTAEADAFAGVLGRVVPTAATLGVSFDQVTAALAGMTLSSLSADEAATSLNQVLVSLLNPSREAETTMADLGLSAAGLREELREKGLLSVLRHLEEAFQGNDEAAGNVFGNVRALRGVLSLLGLDAAQLNDIFKDTATAQGDLAAAYKDTEGTARDFDRIWVQVQTRLIELSEDVMPVVLDVLHVMVDILGVVVDLFDKLPGPVKTAVVVLLALVALAGPLLLVSGGMLALAGAAFGLGVALAPIALIVGGIVLAVGLAYTAVTALLNALNIGPAPGEKWKSFTEIIGDAAGDITLAVAEVHAGVDGMVHALTDEEWAARDAIEANRILTKSLPAVAGAYKTTAAEGPEAYQKRQDAALDKAIADLKTHMADALSTLQGYRTEIEDAYSAAIDAEYDAEITRNRIIIKNAELVAADKALTKARKDGTKAQIADAVIRRIEILQELTQLKLHSALIGDEMHQVTKLTALATGKDMHDGLTSKLPEEKAAYEALQASIIADLRKIETKGGPAAKDAAKALKAILDPNSPTSPLRNSDVWGDAIGAEYGYGIAGGIRGTIAGSGGVVWSIGKIAAIMRAGSPPGPESPLHEIDTWGARTGAAWLNPFVAMIGTAASALRSPLAAVGTVLGASFAPAGLATAAASAGIMGAPSQSRASETLARLGGGPLIGTLHVDARGHPDADATGAAVAQAVLDHVTRGLGDQSLRGPTRVNP